MARGREHLRDSPVTTASMVRHGHGMSIYCRCGNQGRLSVADIARAPDTKIYAYKSRLRCTRCGLRGDVDEVEIRISIEDAPFSHVRRMREHGTPPQRFAM